MNEQIMFEVKSVEIRPLIKSSIRIELVLSLNSLKGKGFKVEKL